MRIILAIFLCLTSIVTLAQEAKSQWIPIDSIEIFYDVDKSNLLESDAARILDKLGALKNKPIILNIASHTDTTGSITYNQALSMRRSQTIRDFLESNYTNISEIDEINYGENNIIYNQANAYESKENRKTTIRILKNKYSNSLTVKTIDEESKTSQPSNINIISLGIPIFETAMPQSEIEIDFVAKGKAQVNYSAKGYFPGTIVVAFSSPEESKTLTIPMKKIKVGRSIRTSLNFEGDRSILLNRSLPELENLKRALQTNEEFCFEIEGHINNSNPKPVAYNSFDHNLSIARSQKIREYLIANNIDSTRLLSRGYGNTQMIFPHPKTPKQMEKNRRVQVTAISCDSTRTIPSDRVDDPSIFERQIPMLMNFNKETYNRDLQNIDANAKRYIMRQVKHLVDTGKDPASFTYQQLYLDYQTRTK